MEIYGGAALNPDPDQPQMTAVAQSGNQFVYADDAWPQPIEPPRRPYCYFIPEPEGILPAAALHLRVV